jgi:hypothetical protein
MVNEAEKLGPGFPNVLAFGLELRTRSHFAGDARKPMGPARLTCFVSCLCHVVPGNVYAAG